MPFSIGVKVIQFTTVWIKCNLPSHNRLWLCIRFLNDYLGRKHRHLLILPPTIIRHSYDCQANSNPLDHSQLLLKLALAPRTMHNHIVAKKVLIVTGMLRPNRRFRLQMVKIGPRTSITIKKRTIRRIRKPVPSVICSSKSGDSKDRTLLAKSASCARDHPHSHRYHHCHTHHKSQLFLNQIRQSHHSRRPHERFQAANCGRTNTSPLSHSSSTSS
jgi:hypothetical protein